MYQRLYSLFACILQGLNEVHFSQRIKRMPAHLQALLF